MNCNDAYELLLEADPADLRAEGNTRLATHLRSCDRCAARAAQILIAQSHLADQLAQRRAGPPLDHAIAAAAAEVRRRRSRRRLAWRVAPGLAAAAIAGILIATRGTRPSESERTPRQSVDAPAPTVAQTPIGQNVVVYETDNPNVVIVWLY